MYVATEGDESMTIVVEAKIKFLIKREKSEEKASIISLKHDFLYCSQVALSWASHLS